MLEIRERSDQPVTVQHGEPLTLTLVFQDRQRSRLRVTLSNGQEAALLLARGQVLRGGDTLALSDGRVVRIEAAPESVSTVRMPVGQAMDPHAFARAAYHLGNRHVPLQVGAAFLRYLHDYVLDGMVLELGLQVVHEEAPFEPESGAYGRHTHGPGHHHGHAHAHGEHDQAHGDGPPGSSLPRALGLVTVSLPAEADASERGATRVR